MLVKIDWKFKCNGCGYKFQATEPAWLFKKFGDSCWRCGSKDIEKKVNKRVANVKERKMAEYFITVEPEGRGAPYTYKSPSRLWAEWLKNQLKRLGHKATVEKTSGGKF